MINHDSINTVKGKTFRRAFIKPAVDSYYFGRIPGTLSKMLTGNPHPYSLPKSVFGVLPQYYDKVICLFIDAFGWRFVEEFRADPEFPLLQKIVKEGCASALSSQFPSTTSVHVPTIMTGLPAGQHHLTEWYYHSSEIDKTVAPLLGTTVDGEALTPEELLKIYPRSHIVYDLQRAGVATICNASAKYINSFFNQTVTNGAERVGFSTPELGLQNVIEQVSRPGKSQIHFYCDTFDHNLHECGPGSPEAREALRLFFSALESALPEISRAANGTLGLVIIADHGQERIDPDTVTLVDELYPSLMDKLKKLPDGTPITRCGGPRDCFLHVQPEAVAEVYKTLVAKLAGKAEVVLKEEFIREQFWGPEVSPVFLSNLGDIALLPHAGESIWWSKTPELKKRYRGHHGGALPSEMMTSFLLMSL